MSDYDMSDFFGGMADEIRDHFRNTDWRHKTLQSLEKVLELEEDLYAVWKSRKKQIDDYVIWKLEHVPSMRGNFAQTISWFNEVANRDIRKNKFDYLFKILVARQLFLNLTGLTLRSLRARIVDMVDAGEVLWRL